MTADERPLVVKLGGTTIAEEQGVLAEIAAISRERRVVVVHGGGKRLTDWLDRLDVDSRFHEGLRVTDEAALEVAVAVLGGLVNTEVVAELRALGANAVGLRGVDGGLLVGKRLSDLGRVVSVRGVRREILDALFVEGFVPVVAPLAADEAGLVCNVNADDASAGLAAGLDGILVLLTDSDGVRGADGQRIPELTASEAERLIEQEIIAGGMVPKVRSAARALSGRGSFAVIADGRVPGAIERALAGSEHGTRIRASL